MKADTTMRADTETSGSRFFTWAIILVTAGVLAAMTADFTGSRTTVSAETQTVETSASQNAS